MLTPAWLFGLLLLPLIRWLHRGGQHRRALEVSHLALWHAAATPSQATGKQPPDPAWRRRALLTALVVVALAGPQWSTQKARVTLWVDDSLSMLTREPESARLALAIQQARNLLPADAELEFRLLGDPWRALAEVNAATLEAAGGPRRVHAPPAALLHREREHWLLTDGTKPALMQWPGSRQADRIIQVGQPARNMGLERLSARRLAAEPRQVELLLRVHNGGSDTETRELVVSTESGELARSTLRLEPGRSSLVPMRIAASARVKAMLEPADALAQDDVIELDLEPLQPRRVAADPTCPNPLLAAVRAHPALQLVPSGGEQARLECGAMGNAAAIPTFRVLADRVPSPVIGAALWSPALTAGRAPRIDEERLRVAARLVAQPGDAVLLAIGGEPVMTLRRGAAPLIQTSLDFTAASPAAGPEIPLLVDLVFDQLLTSANGTRLLDTILVTDRGDGASRVTPQAALQPQAARGPARRARTATDLTPPLLLAALLVLLWEIGALVRQRARLAERAIVGTR